MRPSPRVMAEADEAREGSSLVGRWVGVPPKEATSRRARCAGEYTRRDLTRKRRRRQRVKRHRRTLGDLSRRPRRRCSAHARKQPSLSDRADPSPHRQPRRPCRLSDHRPRAHASAHVGQRESDDAEQRQGKTDRPGRVVPAPKHATGHDRDQSSAPPAPVASLENHHRLRFAASFERPALLALSQAMPPKPQPSPCRAACPTARRAPRRAHLLHPRNRLKPRLDVERTRDDPLLAPVSPDFSHWSVCRSTTGECG